MLVSDTPGNNTNNKVYSDSHSRGRELEAVYRSLAGLPRRSCANTDAVVISSAIYSSSLPTSFHLLSHHVDICCVFATGNMRAVFFSMRLFVISVANDN